MKHDLTDSNNKPSKNSNSSSLGYWAAHEQYSMQDLLRFAIEAEKNGFTTTMTSDHFHPWKLNLYKNLEKKCCHTLKNKS
jgi:hypothetical protein